MRRNDSLFLLVQSLTPQEKRHFYKHIGEEESLYRKLFAFLENAATYSDEAVRKQFKGTGLEKHLEFQKKYLYDKILLFLRNVQQEKLLHAEIHKHLDFHEILRSKGLRALADNEMRKAERKALDAGAYSYVIELNHRRCVRFDTKEAGKNFTEIFAEYIDSWRTAHLHLDWHRQVLEINAHLQDGISKGYGFKDQDFIQRMEAYRPHLESMLTAGDFFTRIRVYSNLMWLEMLQQRPREAADRGKQMLYEYQQAPELQEIYAERFIKDINNCMNLFFLLEDKEAIQYWIEETERQEAKFPQLRELVFEFLPLWKCNSMILNRTVLSEKAYCTQLLEQLNQREAAIRRGKYLVHLSSIVTLSYYQGNYHQVLRAYYLLETAANKLTRRDLAIYNRITYLLTHLEMGNEFLPYLVQSAKRFLKTRNWTYEVENILIRHIQKAADLPEPAERIGVWVSLKKALEEAVSKSPAEANLLYNFDIFGWLDARIAGKTLQEYTRNRFQHPEG